MLYNTAQNSQKHGALRGPKRLPSAELMKITAKNTLGQADSGNNEGSYSNALSSLGERATG